MQDILPAWKSGKTHAGEELGCALGLRRNEDGESEVYVKKITPGGPAALSGQLAVGDAIEEINGANPLALESDFSLAELVEGEIGEPIWLKIKGEHAHIPLIRHELIAETSQSQGVLGFSFTDQLADGTVLESRVTEIKPGGALWIDAKCGGRAGVEVGDILTHCDGRQVNGDPALFMGTPFKRVCLRGRRGRDGTAFECNVIRTVAMPAKSMVDVENYLNAVACLPPAPPISRVNGGGNAGTEALTAPLITGLDIKTAAQIVVTAYVVEEIESTATPESVSRQDSSVGPMDRCPDSKRLNARSLGRRVSPTDILSDLSDETRYSAIGLLCAIAAPRLELQKELRQHAPPRAGGLPQMPAFDCREASAREPQSDSSMSRGGDRVSIPQTEGVLPREQEEVRSYPRASTSGPGGMPSPDCYPHRSLPPSPMMTPPVVAMHPDTMLPMTESDALTSGSASPSSGAGRRRSLTRLLRLRSIGSWLRRSSSGTPTGTTIDTCSTDPRKRRSLCHQSAEAEATSPPGATTPGSPPSGIWGSWLRWQSDPDEVAAPAVDDEESLNWHSDHIAFLSGFFALDQDRCSTLHQTLHSKACLPNALIESYAVSILRASPLSSSVNADSAMASSGCEKSRACPTKSRVCSPVALTGGLPLHHHHQGTGSGELAILMGSDSSDSACADDVARSDHTDAVQHKIGEYEMQMALLAPASQSGLLPFMHPDTLEPMSMSDLLQEDADAQAQHAAIGAVAASTTSKEPCTESRAALGAEGQPWTVCWLVLAASVGSRKYDSRSRSCIRHLARHLLVPWKWIRAAEIAFCKPVMSQIPQ